MILGIDEAGRGPVIGPLVLCGVWVRRRQLKTLVEIDVRDSKSFGSSNQARLRRQQLADQIRGLAAHVCLLCVDAAEVDRRVRLGELNLLERELASAIIQSGPPAKRIIADGERLFGPLAETHPGLKALNKADQISPVVAAASIIAKDERDLRFTEIVGCFEEEFGPIKGGGYANPATATFIKDYFERCGRLPPEVRRSWSWSVLRDIDRMLAGARPYSKPEQMKLL